MTKEKFIVWLLSELEKGGVKWPGGAENVRVQATRAGKHQRDAGAWVWRLEPVDSTLAVFPVVGSSYSWKSLAGKEICFNYRHGLVEVEVK